MTVSLLRKFDVSNQRPGAYVKRAGTIGRVSPWLRGLHGVSTRGGRGASYLPHPRRNRRLMIPRPTPRPPGYGCHRPLRPTSFQSAKMLRNLDHLPFSWWFGPALTLPGHEGRRRRQKRPGFHLPFLILLPFRNETRGERDSLAENAGSPHPAKEEPPPFLARRMPFCPGRGLICHTGNHLSSEPIKNTAFSERILLFFSTKWEMIPKFLVHAKIYSRRFPRKGEFDLRNKKGGAVHGL